MAVHNLSAENLVFADKMGGLAVPSIGVVTQDKGAVAGFGEITLLGTRELGDPRSAPIFSADAYTARFPSPEWPKAKSKDAQKLVDFVRATAKEFDDTYLVDMTWDEMVNSPDANSLVSRWLNSVAAQALFLREQGVDVSPVRDEVKTDSGLTAEQAQSLRPLYVIVSQQENQSQYDTPEAQQLKGQMEAFLRQNLKALGKRDAVVETLVQRVVSQPVFRLGADYRRLERGATVDTYKTRQSLEPLIAERAVDFKRWVEGKVLPNFGEPFLKVKNKKVPYTLDNIVQAMTSAKVAGKEKTMTFGAGQVRAAASTQFSSV